MAALHTEASTPRILTGSERLDAAWQSFWSDFGETRDILFGSPLYGRNDDIRASASFLLHQLLYVGHALTLQPDQKYPVDYGSMFQWPAHNTFGLPSPDNTFGIFYLDGRETYRFHGRRNTVYKVWMVVYHGFFGDEDTRQMAEMQIDDFAMNPDGTFEIILSADRHDGNWIEIDRTSRNVPFMLRQNHLDWAGEVDAEWHIERVDIDETQHNPIHDEAEVARRIEVAGRVMVHMANMSRFADRLVLKGADGEYNRFLDLTGPEISKFGTFNRAHYGNAVYEIAPGEALVMTVDQPEDSEYWNVQIGDIWYQIEDYVHHQTSLNQVQAARDGDGLFRLVIAHEDPGVANWLETSGRTVGILVWRVYGPRGHVAMPKLERMPLDKVRERLLADTPVMDAARRREQRRARREAAAKRWRF